MKTSFSNISIARALNKGAKAQHKTLGGARAALLAIAPDLKVMVDKDGKYTTSEKACVETVSFPSLWLKLLKESKKPENYKALQKVVRCHHKSKSYGWYYILEALSNTEKCAWLQDEFAANAAKAKAAKAKAANKAA